MIRLIKILVLVGLVCALLSVAFEIVVVPTASMEGTVLVGDHLLIDRFAYGPEVARGYLRLPRLKKVQRGDVVSFHPPGRANEVYLKRVVAVAGDRVEARAGELYVNGARSHARFPVSEGKLLVPAGQLYVLGDNRDHSEDSRNFGAVPEANVIGEPVMVLWSFANPTRQWLRSQVSVYFDHPVTHLRWERFFQKVQ